MHTAPITRVSAIVVVVLLVSTTITVTSLPAFSQAGEEKGSYVNQVQFIERENEDLALQEVRSGALDMYYFKIPLEAADDAKNDRRLNVYDRTAGSMGLFVNPAPSPSDNLLNHSSSEKCDMR